MSVSASLPGPGPRVLNYSRLASQHLAASWHRVMTPGEMLGCDEARLWGDGLTKSWSHVSLWVNDGVNTDINDCLQRVNGMPITSMQNIQAKQFHWENIVLYALFDWIWCLDIIQLCWYWDMMGQRRAYSVFIWDTEDTRIPAIISPVSRAPCHPDTSISSAWENIYPGI